MFSFQVRLWIFLIVHFCLFIYAISNWSLIFFLISFICIRILAIISIEVALHRLWTHQSFKAQPILEWVLMLIALPSLSGSSIAFAGVHRMHHQYSDTDKDPHDHLNKLKTFLYIRPKNFFIPPKVVLDLLKNPFHLFVHKNYFILNGIVLGLFLVALGPFATGYTLSFYIMWCFVEIGLVNIIAHMPTRGSRKYETPDRSMNNRLLGFIAIGEGLHHNHHYRPHEFNFALNQNEFDPPSMIILGFEKMGLAQTKIPRLT